MNRVAELRRWFDGLESREKRALLLMSTFLSLVLFYLLFWSPVNAFLEQSREDYTRQAELFAYLKSTEPMARTAAGAGSTGQRNGQSMLSAVSSAARVAGITPSRLQPDGSDAVSVWFDAVRFTSLMQWLEQLERDKGIVVRQLTIDERDQPGQVSARLVLR